MPNVCGQCGAHLPCALRRIGIVSYFGANDDVRAAFEPATAGVAALGLETRAVDVSFDAASFDVSRGARLGLRGEHRAEQRRHPVLIVRPRAPAARRVGERREPVRVKAAPPVPHRLHGQPEALGDGRGRLPGGRAEDDLRPAHVAVGQRARGGERGEVRALGLA